MRLLAPLILLVGFMMTACSASRDNGPATELPLTAAATVATASIETAPVSTPVPASVTAVPEATTATEPAGSLSFDGEQAFVFLEQQMRFPERWPGSDDHAAAGDQIVATLGEMNWAVEEQLFDYKDVVGRNIVGRKNEGQGPVIILGAHYDTRRVADQTPGASKEGLSVPGAVDGASGVAVLLELARTLDLTDLPFEVWLAFFDLEDNGSGGLPGWDWIVGSTTMAAELSLTPYAVVVVDMVGDADQQLYYDGNSDPELSATLWRLAAELGFADAFIPEVKYTMIDDHLPFAQKGITAVDIIDFDYPYWHTVEDTTDKASAESLFRVGRTLETWLEQYLPENLPAKLPQD